MAKVHKYDMSRRLGNGKWEVVGKAYKDSESGRLTVWIDPAKIVKIAKGQKDDVPFILFDKDPEPVVETTKQKKHPPVPDVRKAHFPTTAEHMATFAKEEAQRTAKFVPKPSSPSPIETRASDSWPLEFDDQIPF